MSGAGSFRARILQKPDGLSRALVLIETKSDQWFKVDWSTTSRIRHVEAEIGAYHPILTGDLRWFAPSWRQKFSPSHGAALREFDFDTGSVSNDEPPN
jgi:hypothetical protein